MQINCLCVTAATETLSKTLSNHGVRPMVLSILGTSAPDSFRFISSDISCLQYDANFSVQHNSVTIIALNCYNIINVNSCNKQQRKTMEL